MMNDAELLAAFDAQLAGMPMPAPKAVKFEVVFRGVLGGAPRVVGTYSSEKRARSAANRKDLEYGSVAHSVRMAGTNISG